MSTMNSIETFFNGVVWGEQTANVYTNNADINTLISALVNTAATIPNNGSGVAIVGLNLAHTILIPYNIMSAIQNIQSAISQGATPTNVGGALSDASAIAASIASRLALGPTPHAQAAALALTALSLAFKYAPQYFESISNAFNNARTPPRRDPLVLDLDGDGIETGTENGYWGVLFDHNGDSVKTATGWVSSDDGMLVLDRNGNGLIDNGTELFSDSTPQGAGATVGGFNALLALNTNADSKIDVSDAQFADLRVWRDLNQDGTSQANELFTLNSVGITSLDLGYTSPNTDLGNGNSIVRQGSFTRADGSMGTLGDLSLRESTMEREFITPVAVTATAAALPELQGAGMVRDLLEAA